MGRTKGSGQGSIYKRGDKWRGQITINGERLSFTAKKKADVIYWMANVRTSPQIKRQNITVQELAEQWLEERSLNLKPQTFYHVVNMFEKHLYPYLGDVQIQDLTKRDIEKFYEKSYAGNFSDGTIEHFRNYFKGFLEYAVENGIILVNPHNKVMIRKRNNVKKVNAFTEEEQRKIVKYLKERYDPYHAILYFMLATGVRVGEAAALTWTDVDLKEGLVNINSTVVTVKGHTSVQSHPKTASGNRTIYLSDNAICYMKKYEDAVKKQRGPEFVFVNERGNLYNAKTMQYRWVKTCALIGVPYRNLHALRHTFATRALEKGIDIKTVSHLLGHKNVITTMNIYQDVYSAQKIKAADLLNDCL